MKKFLMILAAVCSLTFSGLLTTGCQYDDTDLWNEMDQVKNELNELKSQVNQMQVILNKLSENKGIVSFTETENGYLLTFTDQTTLLLKHGKDGQNGADGSKIGVQEVDGRYYWTVDGELLLVNGEKVAVTGNDGHSPVLTIDEEGFWCVDGKRILVNEAPVPAQGDAFFKKVESKDGKVIFTLADGSQFSVNLSGQAVFGFKSESAVINTKGIVLPLNAEGLTFIEVDKVPAGVEVALDEAKKTVSVQLVDAAQFVNGKRLLLKAADKNGYAMFASIKLFNSFRQAEFLVLNEGWFGHEGGTVNAYIQDGWSIRGYKTANLEKELGTSSTIAVQHAGLVYLISKDAPQIVEADMETLSHQSVLNIEGVQTNNIAILNEKKGYVATSGGVYEIALHPLTLGKKVSDRTAGDIVVTAENLFYISGKKAYRMNLADSQETELCAATTGLVKDAEHLYVGNENTILQFNLKTGEAGEVLNLDSQLNLNPWAYTPSVLNISADGKYLYYASGMEVKKISVAEKKITTVFTLPEGREFYGSAIGVEPVSEKVCIINKKAGWGTNGLDVIIEVVDGKTAQHLKSVVYTSIENTYWFPSSIFFPVK